MTTHPSIDNNKRKFKKWVEIKKIEWRQNFRQKFLCSPSKDRREHNKINSFSCVFLNFENNSGFCGRISFMIFYIECQTDIRMWSMWTCNKNIYDVVFAIDIKIPKDGNIYKICIVFVKFPQEEEKKTF